MVTVQNVLESKRLLRREKIAGAEFAALAALIARRGLPSPYEGEGYGEPHEAHAGAFEEAACALLAQVEELTAEIRKIQLEQQAARAAVMR